MPDRKDAGQEGSRTGRMQNRQVAGQEGCRTGRMQDIKDGVGEEKQIFFGGGGRKVEEKWIKRG